MGVRSSRRLRPPAALVPEHEALEDRLGGRRLFRREAAQRFQEVLKALRHELSPRPATRPSSWGGSLVLSTASIITLVVIRSLDSLIASIDEDLRLEPTFEAWVSDGRVGFGAAEHRAWALALKSTVCR